MYVKRFLHHTIAKIMWAYQNEMKYNTVISCKKIKTLREILHKKLICYYTTHLWWFFIIFQTTICKNKQIYHVTFACENWHKIIHKNNLILIAIFINTSLLCVCFIYFVKKKKKLQKQKCNGMTVQSHTTNCSTLNLGCTSNLYQQSSFLLSSLCSS